MTTSARGAALLCGLACWFGFAAADTGLAAQASPEAGPVDEPPALVAALDGRWDVLLDPENRGIEHGLTRGLGPSWSDAARVPVPGVLEASPTTAGYDGVAWYRTTVPAAPAPPADGARLMLEFDAVNWRADVWLGGTLLGRHDGGDAPFRFDVTGRLGAADQALVVRCVDPGTRPVDGLVLAGLPNAAESSDYNWGGITGSVRVRRVPRIEVRRHDAELLPDGTAQLRLDLENHADAPRSVTLELTLAPATDPAAGAERGERLHWTHALQLAPGDSRVLVPMPGAEALARWSPAHPLMHMLSVDVHDADLTGRLRFRVGLRRFGMRDGRFELDGAPFAVHGVSYPPCYPRGLAHPPDDGFLRRELLAIREAGFNLVRASSRTQPALYALCDELGLLVCAEPSLGIVTHELPETGPAAAQAVSVLADAVSGHPSVVMATLLDDASGELWRRAAELAAVARERMPERLLIDESGTSLGGARAWNPFEPQPLAIDAVHLPREGTPSAALRERVARLGQGSDRLVWVSSWGVPGTPSLKEALAGFGGRLQSEDAREYANLYEALATQLQAGTALSSLASDAAQLSALGAASQAHGVSELGRALRANPRIAGDCFAQWRDTAWSGAAGLCTVWGAPKAALDAIATVNSCPAGDQAPAVPALEERPQRAIAAGTLVDLSPEAEAVIAGLVDRRPESFGGLPRLVVVGQRLRPWSPDKVNVTVALMRFVRDGGTLLWLQPPDAGRPLPQSFTASDASGQVAELPFDMTSRRLRGAGVEALLAFAPATRLLADIPGVQALPDERFEALLPTHVLLAGRGVPADVQCGAIAADGSFLGAAVQSVNYGNGRIVLSTLQFTPETLADPFARRMLENVVRFAAGIASRRPPPPAVADATPPAESVEALARMVWRAQLYFGLAERLAQQDFPGRPMPRDDLPELARMIARKCAGLDAVVAGHCADGLDALLLLDQASLDDNRERFLRSEIALADGLAAREASDAPPLTPAQHAAINLLHARALRLMRLGQADGAIEHLAMASAQLGAAPEAARPAADAPGAAAPLPASAPATGTPLPVPAAGVPDDAPALAPGSAPVPAGG